MANKYKWDGTNLPKVEGSWGTNQSLGQKIETMFTRFTQRVFVWAIDFVSDRLVDIFDQAMKILKPGMIRVFDPMLSHFIGQPGVPDWLKQTYQNAKKEEGEVGAAAFGMMAVGVLFGILSGGLSPFGEKMAQSMQTYLRSFTPSAGQLAAWYNAGLITAPEYLRYIGFVGVPDELKSQVQEGGRNLLTLGELFASKWRGKISDNEFVDYLHRMGYSQHDRVALYDLANNLPPLSDLIHMMVRDAFDDSVASQYGYDENRPDAIFEFFAKQGYDPDWAKRYWRSHWNLPSPSQGYEMLHRGLIDIQDLDTLLRISDYPPFWREKLRDISYSVLTRVDVRRLLQSGLIDEGKALETYKKMGYTPEDAELLTQFALAGISQEERDLTKTDVLNLYEEGLIDRDVTAGNLVKMGYDSIEAENILKLSDVAIAKAARTDLINFAKEKYLAKKIDENTARNELAQIGLKAASVDRYLLNWNRATEVESAIPSMADAKRWYMQDYIDEAKFRSFLAQHRHTQENIEVYVKEIKDGKAEAANEQ